MNHLIIINGSICIGKTSISELLLYSIQNAGWIDSDQTWWSMKPNESPESVMPFILDNTIHCVNNYLKYELNPIIISWFFPKIEQISFIQKNLIKPTRLYHYMLTAKKETLLERYKTRGDNRQHSEWMLLNENVVLPETIKITTDNKQKEIIMHEIINHYNENK